MEIQMGDMIGTYAAYSKDEKLRSESSSGGVFSLLAEKVLHRAGVVYGAAMSQDCKNAEFIRIDKEEELSKLRGSKYLQARVGNTYRQVKADLESGIPVLFSGTGCQVNGLRGFLGKGYGNLYCVDVVCHGVPSPKLWSRYVQNIEKEANAKLISVNFRCKDVSWEDFGIKKIDSTHRDMYISKDKDPYMLMFLRDYCLRPSCYECAVKQQKLADITIGDFWGINHVFPEMNDGKGISLVIVRTDQGSELFHCIGTDIVFKEVSYEDGVRENSAEYSSVRRPEERNDFFDDMAAMDFKELENKYAMPAPVSFKKKIKKLIKKIILKSPFSKFIFGGGGYKVNGQTYGMRFIFEDRTAWKER